MNNNNMAITDDEDNYKPSIISSMNRELSGIADGSHDPLLPSASNSSVQTDDYVQSSSVEASCTGPNTRSYTNCSSAIFLTVNATLGVGLLNVPYAFNESGGILYTLVVHLILVFFVICSLFILTHSAEMSGAVSYQDVVGAFYGAKMLHLCVIFIILYCYGTCLTFVIVIGDQFDRIFLSMYGSEFCFTWYLNRKFTMLVCCTVLILPLSFSKKIDFLKYASLFGAIATFYILFLAFYEYLKTHNAHVEIKTKPDSWPELFYVTPVICFSYQCQLTWVPICSGMKEKANSPKMILAVLISIVICFVSYTLIAFFGLMTFGSRELKPDLMENYDANDIVALVGIILLIAKTVTVYPLMLFCGRVAVEDFLIKVFKLNSYSDYEFFRRGFIVIIWFFSTIIIAIVIPNISTAVKFLGSLASLFVYIFPGMCCISTTLYKDPNLYFTKNRIYILVAILLIIIGVFIFSLTLTQVIQKDLVTYYHNLFAEKYYLCD